ncbi:MAG: hypothetical protein CW691_01820 [Candidatus Bathyarchaeum sp.]|nr:MAG: hypothetical protein CW691_01820 [Candidatus Bathyarchaeum sp.]
MLAHKQSLTVYRIHESVDGSQITEFEQALRDPSSLQSFDLIPSIPFQGQFFLQKSDPKKPSWFDFLDDGINDLIVPEIQRINAVLFVKVKYHDDQIFAITFGQGRYLLRPDCIMKNYGLRVALNVIYDQSDGQSTFERIKGIDAKTVAENTMRTRRQSDRRATFETFGVDIQRDLLRAVTGIPISSGIWGTRISGSDSISINPVTSFDNLGDICKNVAQAYNDDAYQQNFEWIDNLHAVTDPQILKELNEVLIEAIKTGSMDVAITVPEIVDWEDISNFYFEFDSANTFTDPEDVNLHDALESSKKLENLTIKHLRQMHLEVLYSDDEVARWPLLRCLTGELKLGGNDYILSEGHFFEIRKEFLDDLDKFISKLPATTYPLPSSQGDVPEGEYNEVAAQSSDSYLLFDKKTVRISSHTSPIEICDVLTDDGCFIHVKRKLSSSSLSHLFAQGWVSADLFHMSQEYRTDTLTKIREQEQEQYDSTVDRFSKYYSTMNTPGDYEVSYAIVAKWNGRNLVQALPFFSKVNLRRHVDDLKRMGYKYSMACVDVT